MTGPQTAANITGALLEVSRRTPRAPALVFRDAEMSYGELNAFVWQAAQYLFDCGVRPGDVAGLRLDHELLRTIYSLGLMRLGTTFVPLPRSLTASQTAEISGRAGVNVVIAGEGQEPHPGVRTLPAQMNDLDGQKIDHGILCESPEHPLLIVSGSGSTGRPKLIAQTHAQLAKRCEIAFAEDEIKGPVRVMSLTNLEFVSGLNRLLSVIHRGGSACIFVPPLEHVADYCRYRNVSTLFSSVFHAETALSAVGSGSRQLLGGLRSLRMSGSTISLDLRQRIARHLTDRLYIVYGANECGRISMLGPPDVFADGLSVGSPLPGVEVQVVGDDGNPLGTGEKGHIRVRTPSLVQGYLGDEAATQKSFRDGWFHTGDIGALTEAGAIHHFGRSDSMMIVNGINVYPAEIELAVKKIAGVTDAVVLPVPHPVFQQLPVCFVTLEEGAQTDSGTIKSLAAQDLGFRAPREVWVVDRIPRNENGKLQKQELLALLRAPD